MFLIGFAVPHCMESLYPLIQLCKLTAVVKKVLVLFLGQPLNDLRPPQEVQDRTARLEEVWERRQVQLDLWEFFHANNVL